MPSVCFFVDIKSTSHVYFSSLHLPARAALAVYDFNATLTQIWNRQVVIQALGLYLTLLMQPAMKC